MNATLCDNCKKVMKSGDQTKIKMSILHWQKIKSRSHLDLLPPPLPGPGQNVSGKIETDVDLCSIACCKEFLDKIE